MYIPSAHHTQLERNDCDLGHTPASLKENAKEAVLHPVPHCHLPGNLSLGVGLELGLEGKALRTLRTGESICKRGGPDSFLNAHLCARNV